MKQVRKTASEIVGDIYNMLRESTLKALISGDVYRQGMRPKDSRKEDIIIIYTSGQMGLIQSGIVTIHIRVPNIALKGAGNSVTNGQRCEVLEKEAQMVIDSWTTAKSDYKFSLRETISTIASQDTDESIVVIKLNYQYRAFR
jgi:hypothetical protein